MNTLTIRRRNSTIEIVRFVFMFLIVVIHVYCHGNHLDYPAIYALGSQPATALHLVIFSVGMIGVTGFMFISGYYGIHMRRDKWFMMLSMLLFYFVGLSAVGGELHLGSVRGLLGVFDTWWFMSSYLFICLLAPFIEEGIKHIDKKLFGGIVLGCLYYTYVAHFVEERNDHDVTLLLTVYLVARYLRNYPPPKKMLKYSKYMGAVSLLLLCLIPVAASWTSYSVKLNNLFITNNNILLLTASASLVVGLEKKHTYIPWVNFLSSSVLAIYLITDFPWVRTMLDPWLLHHVLGLYGFAYVFAICVGCLLVDKVRDLIYTICHKIILKK